MELDHTGAILLATFVSLFISSIAGYGGSLVLVPALGAILGPKEGIALASLLLGWNSVFKVIAYRQTLALRRGWPLLLVTAAGVFVGARLLIEAPAHGAAWVIVTVVVGSLAIEVFAAERLRRARRASAEPLMAAAAVLSGVSGSSGPLKGVAIRNLGLPRLEHVGLASCISLVGDGLKLQLFAHADLLPSLHWSVLVAATCVMPVAAWVGLYANRRVNERTFRFVFWSIVGGYSLRMLGRWV